jgi:hypothetical protein
MEADKSFEITLKRAVPVITKLLLLLMMVLAFFLILWDIVMAPTRSASQEMSAVYFMLVVPGWLKATLLVSGAGFFVIAPLYYLVRIRVRAVLTFRQDEIDIVAGKERITIPHRLIVKVFCNDVQSLQGIPKGQLQIVLFQKMMVTTFRLRNYMEAEEFMSAFALIPDIPFYFYTMAALEDDELANERHMKRIARRQARLGTVKS